ncbi:P-loop containing nucleoside triphosphate hydrolase protein, partial [Mycena alexandri]
MPRQLTITEIRLKNISTCVTIMAKTLNVLVNTLKISALEAILNTTQSLLKMVETIKQDKNDCAELMEHVDKLLNAIVGVYLESDTGAELPPSILNQIAKFTETLHKIHTFVEAQQSGSKVKKFFRQGELNALLKDCRVRLQQGLAFFQIRTTTDVLADASEMQDQAQLRHQEVLSIIETMSSSDSASLISTTYSDSYTSSNSISMLPAEPKIFHGRSLELAEILKLLNQDSPRIAILGAGGMGKTSLARTTLHHEEIITKYQGNRFFITCDTASNKVELAGLIGAHLGMKLGKDLTQAVLWHFTNAPPSLLILDNLETPWEPVESRKDIEEFLSLLTDITSLALMITMRGAERPAKVHWSRPFLLPLQPLAQDAARKMFIDIADDRHSVEEVDQVLYLTGNMPLSISLLAHLVDMEGCGAILSRWETEKTSLISEGYDKRSNLKLSIALSLSSPRITSMPHSQDLLALLSILPDGLSDVELKQSKFPINDILGCKASLLRTALAYTDDDKRLKVLVPVREYMGRLHPPTDVMIRPLLTHFHELLELYVTAFGKESGAFLISRITSNYTNIQNVLLYDLQDATNN